MASKTLTHPGFLALWLETETCIRNRLAMQLWTKDVPSLDLSVLFCETLVRCVKIAQEAPHVQG